MRNSHYKNLTPEQWRDENSKCWKETLEGILTITLPESYYLLQFDSGNFIEIQMNCLYDEPPGVFVRDSHYGPALKVMIPKNAKPGDTIRLVRKSQSGKSYIAEIVKESIT